MIRTTIYLSDELHAGLKHLAVERRRSMAELLREAVEEVFRKDLADLASARKAWRTHRERPRAAVPARDYFAKRR